jgi:hypothetical protein
MSRWPTSKLDNNLSASTEDVEFMAQMEERHPKLFLGVERGVRAGDWPQVD